MSSKLLALTALWVVCCSSAVAQINSQIPLQYRSPQFEDPMVLRQRFEALRAAQAQADLAEAQARMAREQADAQARKAREEAERSHAAAGSNKQPSTPPAVDPTIQAWLKTAGPRMHLYPDFDTVVFAPDVPITMDVIRLMSGSNFAADISYYLGSHQGEALAISQMPLLDAARAIDRIEGLYKPVAATQQTDCVAPKVNKASRK